DGLVAVMLPALGEARAAHLKERLGKVLADRSGKPGERNLHALVVRSALQALADDQSDVDAYIALVPPEERRRPWRRQIGPLAAAGQRVVAPDLRGYNLSAKPRDVAASALDTAAQRLRYARHVLRPLRGGRS
ncbi:MAG TPA: hypothetical protein VGN83_01280, partial [Falsiroseomonas sp.]|nr:hypothetical protein [Falsiroseomonas sp.]